MSQQPTQSHLPPVRTNPAPSQGMASHSTGSRYHRPPPNNWFAPTCGCVLIALVAGGVVCGGFFMMFAVIQQEKERRDDELAINGPTVVDKPEINVDALDGTWRQGLDTREREAVAFIDELEQTSSEEGQEAFMELVDFDAHLVRYYESYRFEIHSAERRQLRGFELEGFDMPEEASDFRVANVVEVSPIDLMVYTYAQQGDIANTPYVFHLRCRKGESCKLVDWKEIPHGLWCAEVNALGAGRTLDDTKRFAQEAIYDDLNEADRDIENNNYEAAEKALRRPKDGVESSACTMSLFI